MTTIAWNGRYVAADTKQGTLQQNCAVPFEKIRVCGDVVYAFSGYMAWFDAWIEWHKAGADPSNTPVCKYPSSESTLIVFKDGKCFSYSYEMPYPEENHAPDAWGSGAQYALGAMAADVAIRRAVDIATKLDPGSGGPVQVIDLDQLSGNSAHLKKEQAA